MQKWRERELKYEIGAGWTGELPPGLVPDGGRVSTSDKELVSTYYDTGDLALARARITLRRRTGGGEEGWQVKVPSGTARDELRFDDSPDVPAEVADLLFGVRHGADLAPVVRIETHRVAHAVEDEAGRVLAEVADDTVHAVRMGAEALVTAWRELEIELVEGDEAVLRGADKAVRAAGATPSASPSKLARALGTAARTTPSADATTALVQRYLRAQYDRIVAGDLALRQGDDRVHKTRVATRRYRSVLRVFADGFEPAAAQWLDAELAWFAGLLGTVRDAQVLRRHLDDQLAGLPDEVVLGPVRTRVHQELDGTARAADERLRQEMSGERYAALLGTLAEWDEHPPLADAGFGPPARYLRSARRKAAKRLRQAHAAGGVDTALHRARKAGKRARYTAEALEPRLGKAAKRQRKSAERVQEVLGDAQDAVVASEFLRRLGAAAGVSADENGFTYGILWALEQQRRRDVRAAAGALRLRH